jgi:hypothetical protein
MPVKEEEEKKSIQRIQTFTSLNNKEILKI